MNIIYETLSKDRRNKSCTWNYKVDESHYLEIYRSVNSIWWKDVDDVSFINQNDEIIRSSKSLIESHIENRKKSIFFIKVVCNNCNIKEYIENRRMSLERDLENKGKYIFIQL